MFGDNVRIRRLTPRECWRLQGFPDEYFDKAKAAGISDTQLYKQAGNSVSVPVAKAIGERLKEVEEHGERTSSPILATPETNGGLKSFFVYRL